MSNVRPHTVTSAPTNEDDNAALLAAVDDAQAVLRDALGRLAMAFGQCELAVAELTAASFGARNADARDAVNAVMSFRQKLDLVAALGVKRLTSPGADQLLQTVLAKLGYFEEQRNTLLHSKYHINVGPEMYFNPTGFSRSKQRAHRKKGLLRAWAEVDVDAINKLSREIVAYTSIFAPQGPVYDLYHAFERAYASRAK